MGHWDKLEASIGAERAAIARDFLKFCKEDGLEKFIRIRNAVLSWKGFKRSTADFDKLMRALEQGDYDGMIQTYHTSIPNLLLSPRVHFAVAYAWDEIQRTDQGELFKWIGTRCLQGILLTGDGTERQPYLVTAVPDEYDLLMYFEKEMVTQSLTQVGNRMCDILELNDGTKVYFDVTDFFGRGW